MGPHYGDLKRLGEVFDFITPALATQWSVWAGRRPGGLCCREAALVAKYRVAKERRGLGQIASGKLLQALSLAWR